MINDEEEATEDSENIEEPMLFIPPIAVEKKRIKTKSNYWRYF